MPPARQSFSSPHSVSLKVLRLSKPSLAIAEPIPAADDHGTIQRASLAHPAQPPDPFPLTGLLTLPPSFGAAYVGESFACTLCANNERAPDDGYEIRHVVVEAELQTPSSTQQGTKAVQLVLQQGTADQGRGKEEDLLSPGRSEQRIIRHDLLEEGPHVLAVTVTYIEVPPATTVAGQQEAQARTRTFRKLYQFAAQQAVGVRTKIGELRHGARAETGRNRQRRRQFAVEAQIENLTEQTVVLDDVALELGDGLGCTDLNCAGAGEKKGRVILAPGDVQQVAFRLDQQAGDGGDCQDLKVEGGRFVLAQLKVDWRMGMGQDGTLRTGWLGCLRKD